MKKWISLLLVLALMMALTACGGENGDHVINFQATETPKNVDPLLASTQIETMVMENIYESLFRVNEQGQLVNGCAASYTFSGNTCTVTLQEGLRWNDGTQIAPQDFVFALQRAVSPETKAACAPQLSCIAGATEIMQGKQPATTLGVTVSGNSLVFSVVGSTEGLLAALAGPAGIPCNQAFFENCKGRYGMSRQTVLSNGLFQMKGWSNEEPDVFLRLIRNENHRNASTVCPVGAYFTFGTQESGYALLEEGKVDGTLITGDMVKTATDDGYSLLSQATQTYGLLFNTKGVEEMNNLSLRKALVGALQPEKAGEYLPTSCEQATGVILPQTYYHTKAYPRQNSLVVALQSSAKENFAKAVEELGAEALSNFELWYVDNGSNRDLVDYVVQCWQKEFGVYVTLKAVSQSELWYGLENGYCHMGIGRLSQKGKDSLAMLEEFSFAGESQTNGFTSKEYDALLKTAKQSEELSYQQQCEAYLLNNGYMLPLYVSKVFYAFSPSVSNLPLDAYTGNLRLEKAKKTN